MKEPNKSDQNPSRVFKSNIANLNFVGNQIKSTKSNIFTFVPLNLLNQMTNLANIYFVIIAILQMIPSISVTNGTPTTLFPLSFVMLAVLIKDAYEQFYRYQKDKQQNERLVQVLDNNVFRLQKWQDLRVGQIIKIKKQQFIPCDTIVVKTSNLQNKCFVQTKGLDGQTNLKIKKSFLTNIPNSVNLKSNSAYTNSYQVNCGSPIPFLNQFQGSVIVDHLQIPLGAQNLILRGCIIKNVHEVIGIVTYTGSQTKVVLNSVKFQVKKSKLSTQLNKIVVQIFIWQIIIALTCSLFNTILQGSYQQFTKFIPSSNYWLTTMTWWLLMTYFIPISLMVTMQMVKLFQGSLLAKDPLAYSQLYQCFTTANNTSVNQNLGQIKYVFTDKTGTLTKNNMVFRYLICDGNLFGGQDSMEQQQNSNMNLNPPSFQFLPQIQKKQSLQESVEQQMRRTVRFRDSRLKNKWSHKLNQSIKLISLCHDIYVEHDGERTHYNTSSPDQVALINFAKSQNKQLLGQQNRMIMIAQGQQNNKIIKKYQKLAFLQFNSDRKRMSVVIRDPETKKIQILTKGADSTVKQLLRSEQKDLQPTQNYIDELSTKGLRTLMLARRDISQQQFSSWIRELNSSKSIIGLDRQSAVFKVYSKIERDMELLGATAIQDQLQDDVKNTIQDMRCAGMNFFILTGDKRQTAINIGRSCGLVQPDDELVDIPAYNEQNQKAWRAQMMNLRQKKQKKVFLLNAQKIIPPELPLHQTICYRCTPSNKQKIVRHVKSNTSYLTMAVGDGANDVNMITAADVGVGIRGKQGTQAARISDFVAGQFKFIRLLTLYYGRQWYRKNCELVIYSFYKNWFHVSSVIAYGAFSYFSGVVIFNVYLYELLNVVYASWPIIIFAVFDQEYTPKESLRFFQIYEAGLNNTYFNQSNFLRNIGYSIACGIISLLAVLFTIEGRILDSNGLIGYLNLSGSVLLGAIIIIINLKILVMGTGLRPLLVILIIASSLLYWVSLGFTGAFLNPKDSIILKQQLSCSNIYFIQIILIFFLIFIELGYRKYKQFMSIYKRAKQAKQLEVAKEILLPIFQQMIKP